MAGQSCDHCSWIDIWGQHMVVLLPYSDHVIGLDMVFRKETTAYFGGIQHHLGLDFLHGSSTASSINICMSEQFLLPMARNTVTGQTVKTQDLTGARFTKAQRTLAEDTARQLALRMSTRTGDTWQGFVKSYTPSERR